VDLQGAGKGLNRGQQALLQRGDNKHGGGLLGLRGGLQAGLAGAAVLLQKARQLQLGGGVGQAVDLDADDVALRELLADGAQVRLEATHHDGIAQLGIDGHAAHKALGVQ
jgi:hypothetical protein